MIYKTCGHKVFCYQHNLRRRYWIKLMYVSRLTDSWLPVIPVPPSNSESLLESVRELSRLADVVTVSGLYMEGGR